MSGIQGNILKGIAPLLATAGLGTYNSSASTPYLTTQTGIVIGALPTGPDNAIALMTYPVTDDPALSDSVMGLQVRTRWGGIDQTKVTDLDDAIFNYLHGKKNWIIGSGATAVTIVQCLSNSAAPLGEDTLNRWMFSHNYYLTLWRPSTNRT